MSMPATRAPAARRRALCSPFPQPRSSTCRPETCESARSKDRKSTRLNSSHVKISYAVFCLKKKKKQRVPSVPIARPLPPPATISTETQTQLEPRTVDHGPTRPTHLAPPPRHVSADSSPPPL